MALDSKKFFEVVEKNGLVSAKQLATLKNAVKRDSLSPADFDAIVGKKILTKWQAQRLLSGKHNFRVGNYRLIDMIGKDDLGEVYLVTAPEGQTPSRLRLVAKEITDDSSRLASYLDRVAKFQAIQHAKMPRILEVSEVSGRRIVVTECPLGKSLAERMAGKPQTESVVEKLMKKICSTVSEFEIANLKHGSINGHSITLSDKQKIGLDLPADIGFCDAPKNKSNSDAASLGWVACGLLSGDFEKPQITGCDLADKFFEVASDPNCTVQKVQAALGEPVSVVDQPVDAIQNESVEQPVIVDSSKEVDQPVEVVGDIVTGTTAQSTAEPIPESLVVPDLQNVGADGLAAMEKQDDMFGDFDNVEVVSEIQAPQAYGTATPVVIDSGSPAAIVPQDSPQKSKKSKKSGKSKKTEDDENSKTETSNRKVLILASVGGVVGIGLVGLLIFFMTRGNGDNSQVADAGQSSSEQKQNDEAEQKKEKSKTASRPTTDKKKLKSSGLFKGIGPMNQQGGFKLGPKKKLGPAGNQTKQANSNPAKGGFQKNNTKNQDAQPNTNPAEKQNGVPTSTKTNPSNQNPNGTDTKTADPKNKGGAAGNANPGNQSPGPGQKSNPKPDGNPKQNDQKTVPQKKGNEEPVLLIGSKKKDDASEKGAPKPAKLTNPFVKAPNFVSLKLARKGGDNTTFQPLFPLTIPPSLPLRVTLHGGDKASKSKIEFSLRASTSENATWMVSAGAGTAKKKPIGEFTYDGQHFGFTWDKEAEAFTNSVFLINCALRVQASQYQHEVALREPAVSSPLDFSKSLNVTADAKLDNLPNMEAVKTVLVGIPDKLAKFDYLQKKDFLQGRADTTYLAFKKENIDVIRGVLSNKQRGSKMTVNLELNYVTPDKKLEKLTTFPKFENAANQSIEAANQIQIDFNTLMKQYQQLKDENQKREFSRLTGRVKLEGQAKAAAQYKKHLINTMAILKTIDQAKIGVRVYYQAGEIEVDLATPTGQKYVVPQAGPAKKSPKKKAPAK